MYRLAVRLKFVKKAVADVRCKKCRSISRQLGGFANFFGANNSLSAIRHPYSAAPQPSVYSNILENDRMSSTAGKAEPDITTEDTESTETAEANAGTPVARAGRKFATASASELAPAISNSLLHSLRD
jgi:hypothetical protein